MHRYEGASHFNFRQVTRGHAMTHGTGAGVFLVMATEGALAGVTFVCVRGERNSWAKSFLFLFHKG